MTDTEKVKEYLSKLDNPFKAEIEAVRTIILHANAKIAERVKWNAPSFYYKHDLVTFHAKSQKNVHLVFHHIAITQIQSPLLHGDYKDRRMLYLNNMDEVKEHQPELERIINQLVEKMDNEY